MRKFRLLICLILAAMAMTCFVACDEPAAENSATHNHTGEWIVVTEPTCTEEGLKKQTCSICGSTLTEKISELGHDFNGEVTIVKQATCTVKGEKQVKCTRCDEKESLPIPVSEHSMVDKVIKAATCTEAGTMESRCSVCGFGETVTIPALGHDFATGGASDAKCEVGGSVGNFCNRCKKNIEGSGYALGHDYSGEYVVIQEPDCTNTGVEVQYCNRDGCHKVLHQRLIQPTGHNWEKISETDSTECGGTVAQYKCTNEGCNATKNESTGGSHKFGEYVTVSQATCKHGAYRSQTCSVCGLVVTRYFAELSHSAFGSTYVLGAEATTTSDGFKYIECDRCGAEMPNSRVVLPKYTIGEDHTYTVELVRTGSRDFYGEAEVEVYDGDELVKEGRTSSQKITFTLPAKDYTLKISSLPRGYEANTSYLLRPGVISTECELTSHYVGGEKPSDYKYSVGDALYDTQFTSYDGKTYSVKELLKQYKAIFFDFYFTTCYYCNEEMPFLLEAQEKYKDDVLVVFVNGLNESEETVKAHSDRRGMNGIIAKKFLVDEFPDKSGSWGYPTLVVVDCTGVIAERNRGAMYGDVFETMMREYIEFAELNGWEKSATTQKEDTVNTEDTKQVALLPDKRKIN